MKKLLITISILATLLFVAGCGSQGGTDNGSTDSETVKIGVMMPLSGGAAVLGEEMQRVLDYHINTVNETYTDRGYEFELIYEDDGCDGALGNSAFQKLTDVDGVSFVHGGTCSPSSLAIVPLLEDKNVLAIAGTASSPELEGKSPNFFSVSYDDNGNGRAVAEELSKYGKVALITEQHDYHVAIRDVVLGNLGDDVEIVANEEVVRDNTDYRNVLQKVKAAEPDVVFFNVFPGVSTEAAIKQLAELSDWEVEKVGLLNLLSSEAIAIAPEMMEGTIVIDAPTVNDDEFVTYRDAIVEANGTLENLGNYYTASVIDALDLLALMYVKHDGDVEAAVADLSKGKFSGNIGSIRFNGKTFVNGIGVARFVVTDGEAVPAK